MFEIIKPKAIKVKEPIDFDAVKTVLIEGMKDGTVVNLHDAATMTALNGSDVNGLFYKLKRELRELSCLADVLLSKGKTATEIISGVNMVAVNFNAEDIKTYKIEVFGSLAKWKESLKQTE